LSPFHRSCGNEPGHVPHLSCSPLAYPNKTEQGSAESNPRRWSKDFPRRTRAT